MTMINSTRLDKLAIFFSSVCLLHCLLAPLAITLLPILGINLFFEDALFHRLMLVVVLPTSTVALFIGCLKHRDLFIIGSGLLGMLILILIAFFGHQTLGEINEKIVTSIGGLVLALSHTLNFRACQKISCGDDNCSSQHHH